MQGAVFTLHINAARRDVHHVAVTVSDGGDQQWRKFIQNDECQYDY